MNSPMLIMEPSSSSTIRCTQSRCFVSTTSLTMSDEIKTQSIHELAVMLWYIPPKQVQMHTLTGMLMFWGSSMPKSCILAPNLQTTPHDIWSFYGFNGLVKYLVAGSV